jgi:hypothetical protein
VLFAFLLDIIITTQGIVPPCRNVLACLALRTIHFAAYICVSIVEVAQWIKASTSEAIFSARWNFNGSSLFRHLIYVLPESLDGFENNIMKADLLGFPAAIFVV